MTAAGIVIAVVAGASLVVVLAAFVWAAREDGRDQRRLERRLGRRLHDRRRR